MSASPTGRLGGGQGLRVRLPRVEFSRSARGLDATLQTRGHVGGGAAGAMKPPALVPAAIRHLVVRADPARELVAPHNLLWPPVSPDTFSGTHTGCKINQENYRRKIFLQSQVIKVSRAEHTARCGRTFVQHRPHMQRLWRPTR